MDFKKQYDIFHNLKLGCNISKQFTIHRIMMGSGGSNNIILDVTDKDDNPLIIKIIPDMVCSNCSITPDYNQLEIKFYQFFTKKYILTDRTPHLVGIFGHSTCTGLDRLIGNIMFEPCPSYEDRLVKKLKRNAIDDNLCSLLLKYDLQMIESDFDIITLERCDNDFSFYLYSNMKKIDKLIDELNRILFQIIFTLAIIKDDYPGFLHGDLFVRNILVDQINDYSDNDYVAYYYDKKIFYLPANGPCSKINDFGMTVIADVIEPNTYSLDKKLHRYYHKNPFDTKTDIFNVLHDIYDGQNLGTVSIRSYSEMNKIPPSRLTKIVSFMNQFINTKLIDKINRNNKRLLDSTWDIDSISILENSVKAPSEYLLGKYFDSFLKLPSNGKIIRKFNE